MRTRIILNVHTLTEAQNITDAINANSNYYATVLIDSSGNPETPYFVQIDS